MLLSRAVDGRYELLATSLAILDLYIGAMRSGQKDALDNAIASIEDLPITFAVIGSDLEILKCCANARVRYGLSPSESHTVALAQAHRATLYTGNSCFRPLDTEMKIHWIGEEHKK